jgi:hypothetical protein
LDLVGYLASLKTAFDYPEAVPYVAPKGEGAEAAKPAPATPAKGTEGAAPAGQPAPASAVSPSPAPANSGAKP